MICLDLRPDGAFDTDKRDVGRGIPAIARRRRAPLALVRHSLYLQVYPSLVATTVPTFEPGTIPSFIPVPCGAGLPLRRLP